MGRGKVFVLPDRKLNCARAKKPYYDYVPAFYWNLFRDVRVSRAPEGIYAMKRMINRYCHILMKREKIFRELDGCPKDGLLYPWIQEMSEEDIDSMYRADEHLAWERELREKDPDRERRANERMDRMIVELEAAGIVLPSFL